MVSGTTLKPHDMNEIRRELAPFIETLRRLSKRHGVAISTLVKHASLPEPIHVRAVETDAIPGWNDRIAGQ
jgi:hypothetical protein